MREFGSDIGTAARVVFNFQAPADSASNKSTKTVTKKTTTHTTTSKVDSDRVKQLEAERKKLAEQEKAAKKTTTTKKTTPPKQKDSLKDFFDNIFKPKN